jgi:hypothetical protein
VFQQCSPIPAWPTHAEPMQLVAQDGRISCCAPALTSPSTLREPQPLSRWASTRISVDLPHPGAPRSSVVRPCRVAVFGMSKIRGLQ